MTRTEALNLVYRQLEELANNVAELDPDERSVGFVKGWLRATLMGLSRPWEGNLSALPVGVSGLYDDLYDLAWSGQVPDCARLESLSKRARALAAEGL